MPRNRRYPSRSGRRLRPTARRRLPGFGSGTLSVPLSGSGGGYPANQWSNMVAQLGFHAAKRATKELGKQAHRQFMAWWQDETISRMGDPSTSQPPKTTGKKRARPAPASKSADPRRHDTINHQTGRYQSGPNLNKVDTLPMGLYNMHSIVPKWKKERKQKYVNSVWQTVLVSRSNRLANSNNTLESTRYPIKAPETKDGETIQTMLFQPFCSNFSGIHTSHYRSCNSGATDLVHLTNTDGRLDTIQNRADAHRHWMPANIDAAGTGVIGYQGSGVVAGTPNNAANVLNVMSYFDQLVKTNKIDLVFTASRPFPMAISVSLVRMLEPTAPWELETSDKVQLCNALDNSGMEYKRFKTEWITQFTLPGIKIGQKLPTYSVNKTLTSNFLQTNTFQDDNAADATTATGASSLGKSIALHPGEVADGAMAGSYVIMIKYRKVQQPQLVTYEQAINQSSDQTVAKITVPAVTEESFDVPVNTGYQVAQSEGEPFITDQGDETKGSFYVIGKIMTEWGFRKDVESIPSIMHGTASNTDYKKAASLNITPSLLTPNSDALYCQSANHVNIPASTANAAP